MGFMQRIRNTVQRWMIGRNGMDRLSLAMLWAGVALLVLAMALSSAVLNVVSLAVYMLALLRAFSRNIARRSAENRFYVEKTQKLRATYTHRRNRHKNRKQYHYFKCPQCKAWLRVPRGAGQVKVTCGKCSHQFSYIAK